MIKEILFSGDEIVDDGEVEMEESTREEEEITRLTREEEEMARLKRILDEFGIETDPAEVLGGRV